MILDLVLEDESWPAALRKLRKMVDEKVINLAYARFDVALLSGGTSASGGRFVPVLIEARMLASHGLTIAQKITQCILKNGEDPFPETILEEPEDF